MADTRRCAVCGSDDDVRTTDAGRGVCWIHDDRPTDNGGETNYYDD